MSGVEKAAIALVFVPDVTAIREAYDEYVGDVEWYRDHDQLSPTHPDQGYRTGVVESWEEYLAEWVETLLSEVCADNLYYRIDRA